MRSLRATAAGITALGAAAGLDATPATDGASRGASLRETSIVSRVMAADKIALLVKVLFRKAASSSQEARVRNYNDLISGSIFKSQQESHDES